MLKPMHHAVTAGLALALGLGAIALPAQAAAEPTVTAEDATTSGEANLPAPAGYDKEEFYQEGAEVSAAAVSSRARIALVSVSEDMKYFARYESSCNYNQGFSYGDGYNALGYYQFDRRYGLVEFMEMCLSYNPGTYAMFQPVVARGGEIETGTIYDKETRQLTELGQLVENAWHQAYAANPQEFSALQDTWAYNQYYLPAEQYLASRGINIADRSDCVKGLCWGLSNLFGTSGWRKFVGGYTSGYDWNGTWNNWREWPGAGLSDSMTDKEFVETLCNYVVDNVSVFYKAQPQYHSGWEKRYRNERNQCLRMLAAAGTADNIPGGAGADSDASADTGTDQGGSVNDGVADGNDANSGTENGDANTGDDTESAGEDGGAKDQGSGDQNDGNQDAAGGDESANVGADDTADSDNTVNEGSSTPAPDNSADAEKEPPVNSGANADNAEPSQDDADAPAADNNATDDSQGSGQDASDSTDTDAADDQNAAEDEAGNASDDQGDKQPAGEENGEQDSDDGDVSTDDPVTDEKDDEAEKNNGAETDPGALSTHPTTDPSAVKNPTTTVPSTTTGNPASPNKGAQTTDTAPTGTVASNNEKSRNASAKTTESLPETSDPAALLTYATAALTLAGAGFSVASRKLAAWGEEREDR